MSGACLGKAALPELSQGAASTPCVAPTPRCTLNNYGLTSLAILIGGFLDRRLFSLVLIFLVVNPNDVCCKILLAEIPLQFGLSNSLTMIATWQGMRSSFNQDCMKYCLDDSRYRFDFNLVLH